MYSLYSFFVFPFYLRIYNNVSDVCAKPYISFLRCFLRFFSASMRMNGFITCLVHVFFKSLNLRVHAARAAIFAGVQPSRLILRGFHAVRGRCPRLLTVQPSRLDSLACCLWLIQPNLVQIYYCFWRSRTQTYANVWWVLAKRVASPPIVISFLAR